MEDNAKIESFEDEKDDETLQLAENIDIEQGQKEELSNEFQRKRELLEKTKIVRQTWSISEIYQKIKEKKLILDPDYQRRVIWNTDKKTAFIESLYMEIMIPPIYVVEIPSSDILEENKYEVVDGKQRLTAIMDFITNSLCLNERHLEYYSDIYGGKKFSKIREIDPEHTTQMLSSVLDVYVITANSPEFTKYDIFARLNRGAEKLKVNEIRRAIYKSEVTGWITEYVENKLKNDKEQYMKAFTDNDVTRYEDYGRFYRSIAFFFQSNIDQGKVDGYNSRPREMINNVLQELQKQSRKIEREQVIAILDATLELCVQHKGEANMDYVIDSLIPFVFDPEIDIVECYAKVIANHTVIKTLEKSPSTTSNVNERLVQVGKILKGN